MNFLELCRELVGEFGIASGSGPDTVENQTGELGKVVIWIRNACLDIDNRWEDWRYLWLRYDGAINEGDSVGTPPQQAGVKVRRWQTHTLKYRPANPIGTTWSPLNYVPYQQFERMCDPDVATAGPPTDFTVMPDNSLQFNRPADQTYLLKGAFYRAPKILSANSDLPLMPEEYHRIIIVRALKYYADVENASELINAAIAEFPDLLEKLESNQLDAFRHRGGASQPQEMVGSVQEPAWG